MRSLPAHFSRSRVPPMAIDPGGAVRRDDRAAGPRPRHRAAGLLDVQGMELATRARTGLLAAATATCC